MAYTTINKSTSYFNTKLYTGNNTSTNAITGVGFQPDWVWLKARNYGDSHRIYDAVRGASNHISSNASVAQSSSYPLTSFDSDGFTIGSSDPSINGNYNYVSWNWKANGQGSSNTDGSINTTYTSANTTSGFSISTYTGTGSNATIGHGLGVAPKWVLVKRLSNADAGVVYHESVGATKYLAINSTSASTTSSAMWNDTAPTTSVFSIGTNTAVNASGSTYVAYCFAGKKGFSKFGDYTGNGSADGTFVYTGFKPAFLLSKNTSATQGWFLIDNKRANPYNPVDGSLHPNSSAAEDTSSDFFVDFTSNGFKIRDTDAQLNASGNIYMYMAFAEEPLISSNGISATAR